MCIVFVPIGVLFFNRSFESVYGDNINVKLLLNVLGIHSYFGFYGYNATWWFMSAIIPLYILFPLLKHYTMRYKGYMLLVTFALIYIKYIPYTLRFWIFPFVLGIYFSQNNGFIRIRNLMNNRPVTKFLVYINIILMVMLFRHFGYKQLNYYALDGIFGLLIILFGFEYLSKVPLWGKIELIGKHSFNIFLFHTFIYYYYFNEFSYVLKYPPLIFAQLLSICMVISMVLERIKLFVLQAASEIRMMKQK